MVITTATSVDVASRAADIAVLPVGAFEQHGSHLPLSTDTLIACAIANRVSDENDVLLLPPVTVSCSHEHADFAGTVSIRATTLYTIVGDIADSLQKSGVEKLVLVNGHGGNYVLSNVVQEANVGAYRMALFPRTPDWDDARRHAGCETTTHEDMHGGEAETSILLAVWPDLVKPDFADADVEASERRHLLTLGMSGYTASGIIGKPSAATADKGRLLLDSLAASFKDTLELLR